MSMNTNRMPFTVGEHTLRGIDTRSLSQADVVKVFAVEKSTLQPQPLNIGERRKESHAKAN